MATVRRAMSWSTIYQGFVILLFVLLLDHRRANGQILRFGSCPSFSPLKDFEMEKVYLFFYLKTLELLLMILKVFGNMVSNREIFFVPWNGRKVLDADLLHGSRSDWQIQTPHGLQRSSVHIHSNINNNMVSKFEMYSK